MWIVDHIEIKKWCENNKTLKNSYERHWNLESIPHQIVYTDPILIVIGMETGKRLSLMKMSSYSSSYML